MVLWRHRVELKTLIRSDGRGKRNRTRISLPKKKRGGRSHSIKKKEQFCLLRGCVCLSTNKREFQTFVEIVWLFV
ncbi:Uncharacterized protein APZ42_028267 [Daphnia magna]|uniref:Uncharacterized protein n=1 Tax=Daphnia magna TaxID=35525 RepID=A0A164QME1_9CRUS|nr:Uncharacterized protein APZ42_028267 [Daphnia magna]